MGLSDNISRIENFSSIGVFFSSFPKNFGYSPVSIKTMTARIKTFFIFSVPIPPVFQIGFFRRSISLFDPIA